MSFSSIFLMKIICLALHPSTSVSLTLLPGRPTVKFDISTFVHLGAGRQRQRPIFDALGAL
jgi:hypothetical protein